MKLCIKTEYNDLQILLKHIPPTTHSKKVGTGAAKAWES